MELNRWYRIPARVAQLAFIAAFMFLATSMRFWMALLGNEMATAVNQGIGIGLCAAMVIGIIRLSQED
jgi:hypothetical protein